MKVFFLAGSIFSLCALVNGDGSTKGKILVNGVNSDDISVVSCTADSVVVKGNGIFTIQEGQILAHIDEKGLGDSICTPCGPLFRKVVSISGDTVTTTFASFAEVFESDIFEEHDGYSDVLIEPQLRCPHSFHDSLEESTSRRQTEELVGLQFDTFCNVMWGIVSYVSYIPVLLTLGMLYDDVNNLRDQFKTIINIWGQTWNCEVTGNRRSRSLWSETSTKLLVPSNLEEWKLKDEEGKCAYFDCKDPIEGFDCFDSNDLLCERNDDSLLSIHTLDVAKSTLEKITLNSASCSHEVCYASNIDNEICDIELSRHVGTICASRKSVDFMVPGRDVTFPLSSKVINDSCSLMSVVFYIGLKVFGNSARNEVQSHQIEYEHKFCEGKM